MGHYRVAPLRACLVQFSQETIQVALIIRMMHQTKDIRGADQCAQLFQAPQWQAVLRGPPPVEPVCRGRLVPLMEAGQGNDIIEVIAETGEEVR